MSLSHSPTIGDRLRDLSERSWTWVKTQLDDPKSRPFFIFCSVFIISHIWTICLFCCNSDALGEAVAWFVSQLTFSVVHWTTFAFAISILVSVHYTDFFKKFGVFQDKSLVKWLIGIEGIILLLVIFDAFFSAADPYMLRTQSGRVQALSEARSLRKERTSLDKASAELEKGNPTPEEREKD